MHARPEISRPGLAAALCGAQVLALAGLATFPALLPTFLAEWRLSNTVAGWISGVYYAGYLAGVPALSSLTDRIDPRRILLLSTLLSAAAALGFALLAHGPASALFWRFLGGVGLAGVYMPGLKVLSDHVEGPTQSRYVAFYTSSFSLGASLSYLLAGEVAVRAGWRWAFAISAAGALVAAGVVLRWVPPSSPGALGPAPGAVLDFRPVLRERRAMAFVLGYAAHMWELFAMRAWIVAFLVARVGEGGALGSATRIAAVINLLGQPASVGGNEIAARLGRRRTIVAMMLASLAVSAAVGFSGGLPPAWVVALALLYGAGTMADSASLTAGAVGAAPSGRRGATLAVHSGIGFGAAFLGPLAVGVVLDRAGDAPERWGYAFLAMGAANLAGAAAVALGAGRGKPDGPTGRPVARL